MERKRQRDIDRGEEGEVTGTERSANSNEFLDRSVAYVTFCDLLLSDYLAAGTTMAD